MRSCSSGRRDRHEYPGGAPGNNDGSGEVYEFEGDTTQANFGSLLFHITNPTSPSAADFGAAVAGIANNIIVGAPAANLPGADRRGRTHSISSTTDSGDHIDRRPQPIDNGWFWLGGGICRAQHPDRLARRQHGGPWIWCGVPLRHVKCHARAVRSTRRRRRQLRRLRRGNAKHGTDRCARCFSGHERRRALRTSSTPIRRARPSATQSPPFKNRPRLRVTPSAPRSDSTPAP